jgi:hypothetical protein
MLMKAIIPTFILVLSSSLYAHDTSGCSMIEKSKSKETNFRNSLQVKSTQASGRSCWNADSSSVTISYKWIQNSDNESQSVKIWSNINGNIKTLNTQITCREIESISYSKETTDESAFLCNATAIVKTGFQENIYLELAPQINGSWDTSGYARNYFFEF